MTLLFQNPSALLLLLSFPQILRASKILFYTPYWLSKGMACPARRQRAETWIRWIHPGAEVGIQDPEEMCSLAYDNNAASDRYMEGFFGQVRGAASIRLLGGLVLDPHVERFHKIRLLPWLLYETQFYRTARHLTQRGEQLAVVPADHDRYGFHRHFFGGEDFRRRVPSAVWHWLRIRQWLSNGLSALLGMNVMLLALPPILFTLKTALKSGIRRRADPVHADVVMPLIWGFNEEGISRGVKGQDNSYILGGDLDASRVAFFYSDWRFTPTERRLQEERMTRAGIRYFDPDRFPLTLKSLRDAARHLARFLKQLPRHLDLWGEDRRMVWASASLLYNILKFELFADWVEYKVYWERQDYAAAHVVRTILSGKRGRLTVGYHHSAPDGAVGFPIIRYTHMHRHLVWGEAISRSYGAHWSQMKNVLVGYWRSDFVINALKRESLELLEERFRRRFGGKRPLVLLLFPTLEEHNILSYIQEEIEGLRMLRRLPGEFTAVCRFRSAGLADRYRSLGLEGILQQDSRVVIDLSEFTTYEWMALSDAVIVNSISSAMIEAAAAGKPAFAFDHRRLAERIFAPYGESMVLKTRYDLIRVFEQVREGFDRSRCRWDELARDFSHYGDGECIRRVREAILCAVSEAGTGRGLLQPDGSAPMTSGVWVPSEVAAS